MIEQVTLAQPLPALEQELPTPRLKVALMLDGDPWEPGAAATKFGRFVSVLSDAADLVGVNDSRLGGVRRVIAIAMSVRPDRRSWKEHYRKNPVTFALRSARSGAWLRDLSERPDFVLQVGAMSRPRVPAGMPYALYLDFTSALTLREWPDRLPMSRLERSLWRRQETQAYRDATLIFCRGSHVKRSLVDDYGVPADRVHVVGAGANLPLPPDIDFSERDDKRVLFIGSDFKRKGGDVLLAAWPMVLERVPDASLTMLGPTPRPLPPRVETNDGAWEPQRITHELARSRAFVMPSRCETWGDVFIEAMSYGATCVGTTADAIPEIIEDGVTGFVVPPDNAPALAERIVALLAEPGRAHQMAFLARRRVEERFVWEIVIDRMMRAAREVVPPAD